MKFYMTPGSCSTGIHILLEEIGLVFEAYLVNLLAGDHRQTDYLAINPKGTIPTLIKEDGGALTDFQSIAWWLARTHSKRKLLPEKIEQEVQVLEMMNYAVNTIHGEGFARIFTTEKFTSFKQEYEQVKEQGQEVIDKGFAIINQRLAGSDYVVEQFSIADVALFYVEFWAVRTHMKLPEYCYAHYQKLLQRPSVIQVLSEEGYSSIFKA